MTSSNTSDWCDCVLTCRSSRNIWTRKQSFFGIYLRSSTGFPCDTNCLDAVGLPVLHAGKGRMLPLVVLLQVHNSGVQFPVGLHIGVAAP